MVRNEVSVKIPAPPKQATPEELERQDLLARLEALEKEIKKLNMNYRVPDPPAGLQRKRVTASE